MSFENQIQQWVTADNQLRVLNDKTKVLRELKHDLTGKLISYAEQNNSLHNIISISDGKLKFGKVKTYSLLTFRYIEQSLSEIIHNKEQVIMIMNHLRENREIKVLSDIKRFSNN